MHKSKLYILSLFIAIMAAAGMAAHASDACKAPLVREQTGTVRDRISRLSPFNKLLGVALGAAAIYVLVSYRRLENRNDRNEAQLGRLQTKVADYESALAKPSAADAMKAVRETDVYLRFLALADKPLLQPDEADWQLLAETVAQHLPSFPRLLLAENGVSTKEYRLSMLALLAFKPGQMAVLTGFTSSDISQTRRRLLQKVFGEQGSATCYDKRIRELSL